MTDEEEYQQLTSYLAQHSLGWLAEEVEADVRAGKFTVSKRKTIRENVRVKGDQQHLMFPEYSPGPTEEFTVPENYSSREKLVLLFEAIRRVLADPVLMEESIASVENVPITFI